MDILPNFFTADTLLCSRLGSIGVCVGLGLFDGRSFRCISAFEVVSRVFNDVCGLITKDAAHKVGKYLLESFGDWELLQIFARHHVSFFK